LAWSRSWSAENTTSATRAASLRPSLEPPAWTTTGRPCGDTCEVRAAQEDTACSVNAAARSYREAWACSALRPKLRAATGPAVVTTFHPNRPPEA